MIRINPMFQYPDIDPIAFGLGPLQVRWYGLMYLIGFALAWFGLRARARRQDSPISHMAVDDLIFYVALGVILGGRVGYMFFYNLSVLIENPFSLFRVWEGGMSFHGGLIGVAIAMTMYARQLNKPFYAIGDIQGCAKSFEKLLEKLSFDHAHDRLWLTGDLVNRGPDSLSVLRRLIKMDDRVTTVLGNHDLHLLAIAAGVRKLGPGDTLQETLQAPDLGHIIDWLRRRPLLHYDQKNDRALVHAGLSPEWSLEEARDQADEVANMLKSKSWKKNLATMYGDKPNAWSNSLALNPRRRFSINALTRIRFCDEVGRLDFTYKGPPGTQPEMLKPWYDFKRPKAYQTHIYFGHWASLGLAFLVNSTCLDTGCIWGRKLTALPIDPPGEPISVPCAEKDLS